MKRRWPMVVTGLRSDNLGTVIARARARYRFEEPVRPQRASKIKKPRADQAERAATCIGIAWALQGLWAAAWMTEVERLDQPKIVQHLFVMAATLCAGALLFGIAADRLRRFGIRPQTLLGITAIFLSRRGSP
jgi:hypothetical protein